MRERFDQSPAIDAASNLRLVTMIQNHDEAYTEKEQDLIRSAKNRFAEFEQLNPKELKMLVKTTTARVALKKGDRHVWGYSRTTVRAPGPEHLVAHMIDYLRRMNRNGDELEKSIKRVNDHNRELYLKVKAPASLDDRDFLNRQLWCKRSDGSYIIVGEPIENDDHPIGSETVRAHISLAMKFRQDGDVQVVEYLTRVNFGGSVPAWLTNASIAGTLSAVTKLREHHHALRGIEEWDEEDGKATGEILVAKTKEEKHHGKRETRVESRVRELMRKQKGLKELGEKHEWFEVLLKKVVANKLRPAGDSKAKLCNMSAKQANVIGGALASCIAANLTAPAAVDEWILRYPAMGELDREYVRERAKRATKRASGSGALTTGANDKRQQLGKLSGQEERASAPTTDADNLLLLRERSERNARAT
jgi:hypothetical protein